LCAHLSQIVFWKKYWGSCGKPQSEFSVAAQGQLQEQANRLHLKGEVASNFGEIGDLLEKKPQYTKDPAMLTASQRLIASLNTFEALADQANKQ